ncbi:MAG: radical SAM family heme chaperone HemW [Bacteroidota bacterium]
MNGLYLHIPFCRKACRYCDFYFTVSLGQKASFLEALQKEIGSGRIFPDGQPAGSVYFGGGTPSVLAPDEIEQLLSAVKRHYPLLPDPEITLEANPDDLSRAYLKEIREAGINRLSIGVQSFDEQQLELMRRSHDARKARESIELATEEGFGNINADLIYGIPGMSEEGWRKNLTEMFALPVAHLSAYHLTFEPGTVFDHWRKKGRIEVPQEEDSLLQYRVLREMAAGSGFEHYEISNFARSRMYSRHNSLYWQGGYYLGFGPSAHSYDGDRRSWNPRSLSAYVEGIESGRSNPESELLSKKDRYHDYLITTLRTVWGADLEYIRKTFGEVYLNRFEEKAALFLERRDLLRDGDKIKMTGNSWLVADHILRELFLA